MHRFCALTCLCLSATFAPGALHATSPARDEVWLALSDHQLEQERGGFTDRSGLSVSFGIARSVTVNGFTTNFSFRLPDLGQLLAQTQAPRQTSGRGNGPVQVQSALGSPQSPALIPQSPSADLPPQMMVDSMALPRVIQHGPGNVLEAALPASSPALVVQNTLNNQAIQVVTQIDISTNGLSRLQGLNLLQTLTEAIGAAIAR